MIDRLLDIVWIPYTLAGGGLFWAAVLLLVAWTGVPGLDGRERNAVQRVVANGSIPLIGQLVNRAVDLGFAAVMLRILGVTGNGQYAIAVITWLYVKTITDFGLGVLATREIARDRGVAGRLVGSTTLLRLGILIALIPVVAAYVVSGLLWFDLSTDSALAIVLLMLTIVPGSYTEAVNAAFNGFERMTFPAVLNVLTNLTRVGLGLAVLAWGGGVVGLAGVALVTTGVSALAYRLACHHLEFHTVWRTNRHEVRTLIVLAWPLLLNALLINLFFRLDVFIIQSSQGDHELGIYDAAYKYINMLLLVPAYFTLAIFPVLSRQAGESHERLGQAFHLATKLMSALAFGVATATMVLAPALIRLLGGEDFLPDSALALRILVWFLPFSYVNGVMQYVLIALDRQRTITSAFAIAVGFNLVVNLLFIPLYGFVAAAVVTVLTELVLFLPLLRSLRRSLGNTSIAGLLLRPAIAAAAMGVALYVAHPLGLIPAILIGVAAYTGGLIVMGVLGEREVEIARALVGRTRPAAP